MNPESKLNTDIYENSNKCYTGFSNAWQQNDSYVLSWWMFRAIIERISSLNTTTYQCLIETLFSFFKFGFNLVGGDNCIIYWQKLKTQNSLEKIVW